MTVSRPPEQSARRQRVLVLYLSTSSLDSPVVGWSLFDGSSGARHEPGDVPEAPYETGLDALCDGWRLFQASQLGPPAVGEEYVTSFQKFEFFFEQLVEPDAADGGAAPGGTAR